ncbi:GNAT family N-acetyltransferase [Ruminococcaceae bacterium OttesenSCG-928-N02]|nr:GNAT family N-acetyltransferase [Ruminococcaceae bacterium OttesenSCG-928-N02]
MAVHPVYQRKGTGRELVRKCKEACPHSEWLVQTDNAAAFYKKTGSP